MLFLEGEICVIYIRYRDPRQLFMSLGCYGLQCSGIFMVVATVDPDLQILQQFGKIWRTCPIKKTPNKTTARSYPYFLTLKTS
ncbi:hypothetical protein SFRURICE_001284, partial [Spodoptera frugiperda]